MIYEYINAHPEATSGHEILCTPYVVVAQTGMILRARTYLLAKTLIEVIILK